MENVWTFIARNNGYFCYLGGEGNIPGITEGRQKCDADICVLLCSKRWPFWMQSEWIMAAMKQSVPITIWLDTSHLLPSLYNKKGSEPNPAHMSCQKLSLMGEAITFQMWPEHPHCSDVGLSLPAAGKKWLGSGGNAISPINWIGTSSL